MSYQEFGSWGAELSIFNWWGHMMRAAGCSYSPPTHAFALALSLSLSLPESGVERRSWQFPAGSSIIKEMGSTTFQQNSGWLQWMSILCASPDLLNAMLEKSATFQPHLLSHGILTGQGTWQSQSPGLKGQMYPKELHFWFSSAHCRNYRQGVIVYKVPLQVPIAANVLLGCKSQGKPS